MVVCVDKEPRGDGPICINHLHEVRECEARGDCERKMYNAIEGGLEEAVMAADGASNAAKLLKVVAYGLHRETIRDGGHSDGGDGVARGPSVH
jgi:hypothetical protein